MFITNNILTNKAERRYVSVVCQVIVTSSSATNQTNPFVYQHCLSILLQRTMCHLALKVCLVYLFTFSVKVTSTRIDMNLQFPFQNSAGSSYSKPVNANLKLKVSRRVDFSCIKMFFTAYVLCSLRLFKPKTKEQTI